MLAILIIAIIPAVLGQQSFPEKCNNFVQQTKQNFNAEAYLGKWYEIARYESSFQKDGDCVTATYSSKSDGTIGVVNELLYLPGKESSKIEGFAVEENPGANDGKLSVKFPLSPKGSYWVVDTDYTNYSVVWSCYDLPNMSLQFMWILSRENKLTPEIETTVNDVLTKNNLNKDKLRKTVTTEDQCGAY